ncbi:MAG: glycerophosphodiester phosphodiesterase [Chloroflexi bacterium]|nr:glycerophosphodiester phosphodiesterase [Chloroflexota bacterium]
MSRPLNIAHRGFTKDFPGNTLEAFQAAFELGADGIEFDVRETLDRRFVIFHDAKILGNEIEKLSLAEIQKITLKDRFKIPTLEETLDLSQKRGKLIVELKRVKSMGLFLEILRAGADLNELTVASFHRDLLVQLAGLAPEFHRAIITGLLLLNPVRLAQKTKSAIVALRLILTTSRLVEKIHRNNLGIAVWDCAGAKDVKRALRLGVDAIISDTPDIVIQESSTYSE